MNVRVVITVSYLVSNLSFLHVTALHGCMVVVRIPSVIMHRLFLLCPAFKSYHVAANSPTEIAHLFLSTST